jgi:hypothetical protein
LQIEINFFLDFQRRKASKLSYTVKLVTCPEAPSAPSFTKIQVVTRDKTRKTERLVTPAARSPLPPPSPPPPATEGEGSRLAAVGLSRDFFPNSLEISKEFGKVLKSWKKVWKNV